MSDFRVAFLYMNQVHDEFEKVVSHFKNYGVVCDLINIDQQVDWKKYDMLNLRECRGFHLDPLFVWKMDNICKEIDAINPKCLVANSLAIVKAAADKNNYLRHLYDDHVDAIPTHWLTQGAQESIETIIRNHGWEQVVVKPTLSSKCWSSFLVRKSGNKYYMINPLDKLSDQNEISIADLEKIFQKLVSERSVFVQEFMPSVLQEGESSFIFIDNEFSHGVQKKVPAEGWVAHEFFGGSNYYAEASTHDIGWAKKLYEKLVHKYGDFLYARIDGIRDKTGALKLLECELIVPRLFLTEGNAFDTYAKAIMGRLRAAN